MNANDKNFLRELKLWLSLESRAPRAVREYFKDGVPRLERGMKQKTEWHKNGTDSGRIDQ